MTKLAKKTGKLVKGGEPDLHTVAVALINDYQRVRAFACVDRSCLECVNALCWCCDSLGVCPSHARP